MAYFNNREREQLDKLPAALDQIDEYARHPHQKAADDLFSGEIGVSLQTAVNTSVHEVESVIIELQALRQRLSTEGTRVQKVLAEYTSLSQLAINSAQVISESLRKSFPNTTQKS
jgi:hypothetical protein